MSEPITLAEAEALVGEPAGAWVARCSEIATKVAPGVVDGTVRRGHYVGAVAPTSHFGERAHLPFQQHGWIELADGTVVDPTRWCFEDAEPYIFHGPADDYDAGGNVWRERRMTEPPRYEFGLVGAFAAGEEGDPQQRPMLLGLPLEAWQLAHALLDYEPRLSCYTTEQVHWLANVPLDLLGDQARPIYEAIIEAGWPGFIPLDNRELVLGD